VGLISEDVLAGVVAVGGGQRAQGAIMRNRQGRNKRDQ